MNLESEMVSKTHTQTYSIKAKLMLRVKPFPAPIPYVLAFMSGQSILNPLTLDRNEPF